MFFFRSIKRIIKSDNVPPETLAEIRSENLSKDQAQKSHYERTAEILFDGPEKYNCAQAILLTFKSRFSVQKADILSAKKIGYGKVKDGLCGALYAGKYLLKDQIKSEQLTREFENKAGSIKCKKILRLKLMSCRECVGLAARLIDEISKDLLDHPDLNENPDD